MRYTRKSLPQNVRRELDKRIGYKLSEQIAFTVECLDEYSEVEGNASAIDKATDTRTVNSIYRHLNAGNRWAWCTVRVVVGISGTELERDSYLGCCSYKSERDFLRDGYFVDMVAEQLDALKSDIDDARTALGEAA